MEQETDSSVIALVKELQKQIAYLERKIDILIAQSAARPSGGKHYPSAPRAFAPHQRRDHPRAGGYGVKHGSKQAPYSNPIEKNRSEEGEERYTPKKRAFRPGDKDRAKERKRHFPGSFDKHK